MAWTERGALANIQTMERNRFIIAAVAVGAAAAVGCALLTSTSANEVTRGTFIGVWVAPAGEQTLVTVVTKRKFPTNMVTTLTEGGFHEYFADVLAGKQLIENSRKAQSR